MYDRSLFCDDLTADRSSRMNRAVFKAILYAQIQTGAAEWIRQSSTVQVDNSPKQTAKFLKAKKWGILQSASQSLELSPGEQLISH